MRRFLQTSVSLQSTKASHSVALKSFLFCFLEPLKSKVDRYERILNEIGMVYREIKAERLCNLNDEVAEIKTGKIPSVETLKAKMEKCSNWKEIGVLISLLREIRLLRKPQRTEISKTLLKKLEDIYEKFPEEESLIKCLNDLVTFEQLNPVVIPSEVSEEASEIHKRIIYTLKDMAQQIRQ